MEHLYKYLILACMGLFPMQLLAQVRPLHTMPPRERDSIMIEMAKECVLKYGPAYYRDEYPPVVSYKGVWGRRFNYYKVAFPYNKEKEDLREPFAASILINADANEPFRIYFGNACMLVRPFPDTIVPYQQVKDMDLFKPDYTWSFFDCLDSPDYESERIRDSLFMFWCNRYVKEVAPDYFERATLQVIDTGRYEDGEGKGEKFFRLNYYRTGEDTRDKEYLMSISVRAVGRGVDYLHFNSGIKVVLPKACVFIQDTTPPTSTCAFLMPVQPLDLEEGERQVLPVSTFPPEVRDSLLLQTAKEVVMAIGPSYYREYQRPLVDSSAVVDVGEGDYRRVYQHYFKPGIQLDTCDYLPHPGREYYRVRIDAGLDDDFFETHRAAEVSIWADTGQPFSVIFGNDTRVCFDGLDYSRMKPIVPLQDRRHRTDSSGKLIKK